MRASRVLLVLVLPLATACGGGGSSSPAPAPAAASTASTPASSTPPVPTYAPDLRAAVQAYSDAFLTGKGDAAYALLSKRCRARIASDDFTTEVTQAGQEYGHALPFATYKADEQGTLARVTYTYADAPEINQNAEPWTLEGGAWHEDDC